MFRVGAKQTKTTSGGTGTWGVLATDIRASLAPISTSKLPEPAPRRAVQRVYRRFTGTAPSVPQSACRSRSGLSGEGRVSCRRRVWLRIFGLGLAEYLCAGRFSIGPVGRGGVHYPGGCAAAVQRRPSAGGGRGGGGTGAAQGADGGACAAGGTARVRRVVCVLWCGRSRLRHGLLEHV